jgi:uncharacterized protein YbjQ (UPF0145 family)
MNMPAFTSNLSIDGFAICDRVGLAPIAQVMGNSIYQMGYNAAWSQPLGGFDPSAKTFMVGLDTLSRALNEVRGNALQRLADEARRVDGDAVVEVHTHAGESELETGTVALEHTAIGTAVRHADSRGDRSSGIGQPVLTELSVADYTKLIQAGYEPRGIVAWSSVFFAGYSFGPSIVLGEGMLAMGTQNFELRDFTQAFYEARETVMGQLSRQASALGADGVVGMRIDHTATKRDIALGGYGSRTSSGLMIVFTAIGTAIRRRRKSPSPQTPKPTVDLLA